MTRRTHVLVACGVAFLIVAGATPAAARASLALTPPAGAAPGPGDCTSAHTCYTPQQLEVAYGVQPLLRRGIDGRGETEDDATHHVTVVAATGDVGAAGEAV